MLATSVLAIRLSINDLAVFLDEAADMRTGQQVQHCFRRPAQFDAFGRHHDRAVDEDRMREHLVDQLVIGPFWVAET